MNEANSDKYMGLTEGAVVETELSPEKKVILQSSAERIEGAIAETESFAAKVDAVLESHPEIGESAEAREVKERLAKVRDGIKRLGEKFVEGTYMYVRLAVLGGILFGPAVQIGMAPEKAGPSAAERAKIELKTEGITKEQRRAYIPIISDLIRKGIFPFSYSGRDAKELIGNLFGKEEDRNPARQDAWRLYLGMPQKHDTFGISSYRPKNSKEDIYYYEINGFFEKWSRLAYIDLTPHYRSYPKVVEENIIEFESKGNNLRNLIRTLNDLLVQQKSVVATDSIMLVMGSFKVSKGKDEKGYYISYYDKWKLDIGLEKGEGFFGKSFEIYDRIYYDPKTFEPINVDKSAK